MKKIIIVLLVSLFLSACNNKPTVNTLTSTPLSEQRSVPLVSEEDIVRTFFNLIDEDKPSEAVIFINIILG